MPTDHMSHIPAMIQQYKEKKKDIKLQIIWVYVLVKDNKYI